jgi:carbon storage regulator CsrA
MYIVAVEKNQKIHIGNDIYLVVRRVKKSKEIEIGIEAPNNIGIHREEFWKVLLSIQKKLKLSSS